MGVSGMTMFGINIRLEKISETPFVDGVVNDVFKREDERKVFRSFLQSKTVDGNKIEDEIVKSSEIEANRLISDGAVVDKNELLTFVVAHLKNMKSGKVSMYESIIRKIVENQNPEFRQLHKSIDSGKFNGKIPFGYPDASKMALSIFTAKVKDGLELTQPEYIKRKIVENKTRSLAKEMFHGVNKLGLSKDQVFNYLKIIYELESTKVAPIEQSQKLRIIVGECLKENKPIELIHIKCLRFVYTIDRGFRILTDSDDVVVDNVMSQGKMIPKSESFLKLRLDKIGSIFKSSGISFKFTLLVADDDIDIYFPNDSIVNEETVVQAKKDVAKYVNYLKDNYSLYKVLSMSTVINGLGGTYKSFRHGVLQSLKNCDGKYINPNYFEHDRVDHQYTYFRQIFGDVYSRDEARRCSEEKVASVISLSKILESINPNAILVEEDMGGENKIIANAKFPVFFTKLRDEAKYDVE